jgi:hypothetical protein
MDFHSKVILRQLHKDYVLACPEFTLITLSKSLTMLAVIWKLFSDGIGLYEFLFVLLFAAVTAALIYGIDFIYKRFRR